MSEKFIAGIDIGGTNTEVGLVNKEGEILGKTSFKTQIYKSELEYIQKLTETINYIVNKFGEKNKLQGIGIGAPNGNYYKGTIENAPNLKWAKKVPIVSILKETYNMPIKITNDANAAALGEKKYGKAKNMNDFVTITLGTGLGSGFFVNGQLMYGYSGFAGEMGHINAIPNGRLCGCGKHGCLETYVSATGIRNTVLKMIEDFRETSILRKEKASDINSEIIYQAALQGDKIALSAFDFTAKIFGEKLADIIALFSPEAIFLSGGLALSGDMLLKPTEKYMNENTLNMLKNITKLELSGLLNENSGILGASSLINF